MSNSLRYLSPALFFLLWATGEASSQLNAPGSVYQETTQYEVHTPNDPIFIFCTGPGDHAGALSVTTSLVGEKTFTWQKYNNQTGEFDTFNSENSDNNFSEVTGLANGGYRVVISSLTGQEVMRAWVFNNGFTAEAGVSESTCDYFNLFSEVEPEPLTYYDLTSGTPFSLNHGFTTEWHSGGEIVSLSDNPRVLNPPARDTEYTLKIRDRFGCQAEVNVTYQSVVTKAAFTIDPQGGEAPLEVVFSNNSENGDPVGGFEWFFFKDLYLIKDQGALQPGDSIMFIAYDYSPVYTYENSGTYMVKLVSRKTSGQLVCTDTVYLENYIVVDTSFVAAPNVFTPNGDGTNDHFVVKFWSMKEVKISVFNRWGRTVHVYENKNVEGFRNTWEVSAWDGRIGGQYASPGVYFYVIEGMGRDGRKRWKKGFVHLIRDRD